MSINDLQTGDWVKLQCGYEYLYCKEIHKFVRFSGYLQDYYCNNVNDDWQIIEVRRSRTPINVLNNLYPVHTLKFSKDHVRDLLKSFHYYEIYPNNRFVCL